MTLSLEELQVLKKQIQLLLTGGIIIHNHVCGIPHTYYIRWRRSGNVYIIHTEKIVTYTHSSDLYVNNLSDILHK